MLKQLSHLHSLYVWQALEIISEHAHFVDDLGYELHNYSISGQWPNNPISLIKLSGFYLKN
jgi:hypothetical protein